MKNIREIQFTVSFVDATHWNAIATLGSLEELSFKWCTFLQDPADVEPEKRVMVKVSTFGWLDATDFTNLLRPWMFATYALSPWMSSFSNTGTLIGSPRLLSRSSTSPSGPWVRDCGTRSACLPSSCKHASLSRDWKFAFMLHVD